MVNITLTKLSCFSIAIYLCLHRGGKRINTYTAYHVFQPALAQSGSERPAVDLTAAETGRSPIQIREAGHARMV